jgi:predicted transport protein
MPIFQTNNRKVERIKPAEFEYEKDLQKLVEENLQTFFNCRFVATEFSTGNLHSGRIDTLALSEDNNPVIIEYKKVASSALITQSLFYLHWIKDHQGDFQVAVDNTIKEHDEIDWSDIRVICIAPEFKKYDLHAVQVMGANIELWQYKFYENGIISIEEVFKRTTSSKQTSITINGKNPVMVEAGKKAAETARNATYTIDEHLDKLSNDLKLLADEIREYIVNIDTSIEEIPKKKYIAYKTTQNFICIETKKKKIILFLKINPDEIDVLPIQARDVRTIGHPGTGDLEITIENETDFTETCKYIDLSLKNIGG